VLARLLELNAKRAHEEALAGLEKTKTPGGKAGKKRAARPPETQDLFS